MLTPMISSQSHGTPSVMSVTPWPYLVEEFFVPVSTEYCENLNPPYKKNCGVLSILRSPPGSQAGSERWSLVYFTRPTDAVALHALVEESSVIANAVAAKPEQNFDTKVTAGEWFARRVKNRRIKNRTVYIFLCYRSEGSPYTFLRVQKRGWLVEEQNSLWFDLLNSIIPYNIYNY